MHSLTKYKILLGLFLASLIKLNLIVESIFERPYCWAKFRETYLDAFLRMETWPQNRLLFDAIFKWGLDTQHVKLLGMYYLRTKAAAAAIQVKF